ncbi:MAG: DHA2 family efflux MFS transporter permease subunit [Hyphomonadaceae bacterium]
MSGAPAAEREWAPIPEPTLGVWLGFLAMVVGQFMAMLDIQIVAAAIGDIQNGVGASRDEVSWVQTSYLIAEVIGIPLSGFLARALGIRLLFTASAIGFAVASVACALSWNMPSLIVFRAIQGFISGGMVPTVMATLYMVFPQRLQPTAGSIIGLVVPLAPSIGPTLGGYISEAFGWRMLFWINVIPAIICAVMAWRFIRLGSFNGAMFKRIDFLGLIGLAAMLGAAQFVLEEGPGDDWFASGHIVFWACVSAGGAFLFFWRTIGNSAPIVDLRPLKIPTFAIGCCVVFVLGASLFGPIFLQPLFLSEVRGYNPEQIGHVMWVQGLVMLFVAPVMGRMMRGANELRHIGFVGFLLVAASCWLQMRLTAESGFSELVLPQILRGAGMMMAMLAVMQPTLQSLPLNLVQSGPPLFNLMRNLGGAFGLAILTTVQTHAFAFHRAQLYAAADGNDPRVQELIAGATAMAPPGSADPSLLGQAFFARILDREALVMAFNDGFFALAVATIAVSFGIFALRKRPNPAPGEIEPSH